MEILVNTSTTPRQLRALAKLFIELAGAEPAQVELSGTPGASDGEGFDIFPSQVIAVETASFDSAHGLAPQIAVTAPMPVAPSAAVSSAATSAPAIATNLTAPTVDKTGRAWNAAVDSSSKAINADGTWRRKKGLSDADYEALLVQLRVAPVVPAVPMQTSIPMPPQAVAVPSPPVALPPPPPPPPASADNPTPVSFPQLMAWAGPHIAAKRLSSDQLNEACRTADQSLQNLQHLIQNQSFVPAVHAVLHGFVSRALGGAA